ncbi:MAG: hypothetical protein ABI847_11130 [Anaerolineales bacterium]
MTEKPPAKRRPGRSGLFAILGIGAGALLIVLSRRSLLEETPATIFYPGVMLYNYAAITLATTVLLLAAFLLALWIPRVIGRTPGVWRGGLPVALALVGSVLACMATLPQVVVTYRHVDRAELAGHIYQLGVRYAADGNNAYILCDCDRWGLLCRCRALAEAGKPVFQERPRLLADAGDGSLTITAGSETVYHFIP